MAAIRFTNVSIIDGTGAAPFPGEVLVENNRIKAVVRQGEPLAADGAEVVDGGGATLMPGMVEAHAHVTFADTPTLTALSEIPTEEHIVLSLKNAKRYLDAGFTSLNSMASAKARLDVVIRNTINAGDFPGPRMLAATPELTVSSGLGDIRLMHLDRDCFAIVCDGADEFRRHARVLVREGVDTLKINPSGDEFVPHARAETTVMTEEEIAAVCQVGVSHGKRVAVHARSAQSIKLSLKHGARLINHATFADAEAKDMLEKYKDEVFVMPTVGITYATVNEAGPWGLTTEIATSMGFRRELEIACETMKDLKKRGVRILPGGDYGFAWNPIGTDARDLEHFVNLLGFTPMEAIVSATKFGGEIMMMPGELGLVAEGALADLLLVDGDPSADIRILQDSDRFLAIMKDGAFHKAPRGRAGAAREAAE
ncbi:MAG: amidohydrolase family protein [Azospirillaceae bacterium]